MTKVDAMPDVKTLQRIRKAYRARQKTIKIEGIRYSIKRKDRKVHFVSGGEQVTRVEKWLVLSPVSGAHLPHMQIELENMGNLRSNV